jgi:hypothetical protein
MICYGSFCICTPRVAIIYFLGISFTYVKLFESGYYWTIVQHMEYVLLRCKRFKFRAKIILALCFLNFSIVLSASSVFFNISTAVESHIYK